MRIFGELFQARRPQGLGGWGGEAERARRGPSMEEVKAKLATLIGEKKRSATPDNGASWEQAYLSTFDCLDRLGIGRQTLSEKLKVIHIAGTKVSATRSPLERRKEGQDLVALIDRSGRSLTLNAHPHAPELFSTDDDDDDDALCCCDVGANRARAARARSASQSSGTRAARRRACSPPRTW